MVKKYETVELLMTFSHALGLQINNFEKNEPYNLSFYLTALLERFGTDLTKIFREIRFEKSLSSDEIIRAIKRESNLKEAPKKGGPINRVKFYTTFIINSETLKEKVERFENANKELLKRSRQRLKANLKAANEIKPILQFIKERDEREYEEKKAYYHSLYLMDDLLKKSNAL